MLSYQFFVRLYHICLVFGLFMSICKKLEYKYYNQNKYYNDYNKQNLQYLFRSYQLPIIESITYFQSLVITYDLKFEDDT